MLPLAGFKNLTINAACSPPFKFRILLESDICSSGWGISKSALIFSKSFSVISLPSKIAKPVIFAKSTPVKEMDAIIKIREILISVIFVLHLDSFSSFILTYKMVILLFEPIKTLSPVPEIEKVPISRVELSKKSVHAELIPNALYCSMLLVNIAAVLLQTVQFVDSSKSAMHPHGQLFDPPPEPV